MRKNLSIISAILFTLSLPAFAVLSDDEVMSEQYILNHGHSKEMARLINLQSNQINGTNDKNVLITPEPEYYSQQPFKFVRKLFIYLDPGLDDGKFMQHDIKYTNSHEDL